MKRYLCIGLLLIVCLGMVACGQIEDTNGEDDYSLATITKEELVKSASNSSQVGFLHTQVNDKHTYKVAKFSGVEMLESVRATESTKSITFTVESTRESGNLYIYVRCDGEIVGEFAVGGSDSLILEQPAPGKYELCIAGESASFEMTATIQKKE
ncbi:MAG: hypothetical protein IJW70_07680 [Clostridia bacterium]|nr:hypothetical protein [Clostridia bacterium]